MTAPENTRILRLAVPAPLRRLFDYLPPEDLGPGRLSPGVRLRVPFGRRELTAVLVEEVTGTTVVVDKLRRAHAVLDDEPLLSSAMLSLCSWSAAYYQHPVGEVCSAALAPALRDGRMLPRTHWRLTARGQGLPEGALRRAPSQARALAMLQTRPHSDRALKERGISAAVLRELTAKGLIERCPAPGISPCAELREPGPPLDTEQTRVLEQIPGEGFSAHLLEGVTGSGKTEIYLRLIARCLQRGRQALVLLPEIGLTPQTLHRFEARFEAPVAVLHSGLAEGRRLEAWQAARCGSAGIVIGTRSAVFAPLAHPGLIVVDEEHDPTYKQQDGFRYSARDVAVKRAQLEGCPVLLGSATPSVESLHNVARGRYGHHRLRRRRAGGELPELRTIDLRGLALHAGVSAPLLAELRTTVERDGHQALLFLNRRGYAPTLQCHQCAWVAGCDHCDARLTLHLRQRCLRCHHCGARYPLPESCPDCDSTALLTRGLGTEQTEEWLARELDCPIHRVDSDSMRGRDAMQSLLEIAESAQPCVILGTQMLTKGHHFPAVQLVGVLDADALLYSADFRGEERMAQLITQVAGRAGRERAGGKVLVQTHYPDDPLFSALAVGDYGRIAAAQLEKREAAGLPPCGQLSMLRADSTAEQEGERFLQALRREIEPRLPAGARLIGPLPSTMPRRARRFRWQLWCLARDRRSALGAASLLVDGATQLPAARGLNWFIDIDPVDVL